MEKTNINHPDLFTLSVEDTYLEFSSCRFEGFAFSDRVTTIGHKKIQERPEELAKRKVIDLTSLSC